MGGLGDLISPEPTIAEAEVNKKVDERVEVTGYDSSTNESIPPETRNIAKQPPFKTAQQCKNAKNYPNNSTVNSNAKNIIHQPK